MADSASMASNRTPRTPTEGDKSIQRPAGDGQFYLSRSNPAVEPAHATPPLDGPSALLGLSEHPHSSHRTADTASYNAPAWSRQSPSSTSDSSGQMIPPTSSFYDPEQAVAQDTPDYQQWIDAYSQGQMQYPGNVPNQMTAGGYQHGPPHVGDALHPPMHHPSSQLQGQFHFVQNPHYPTSHFDQDHPAYQPRTQRRIPATSAVSRGHGAQPTGSAGDMSASALHGAISYQDYQAPNRSPNEPAFYYPSNNFEYPAEGQQAHYPHSQPHSSSEPMSASTNYTPLSNYAELHQSSVSPPGGAWQDDSGQSAHPAHTAQSVPAPSPSSLGGSFARSHQPAQINSSAGGPAQRLVVNTEGAKAALATGKRPRGAAPAAAGGRGRKRTRKDGGEGGGDSDSSSDDDIGGGAGRAMGRQSRLPGACTHCKKLKMKCDFPKNENVCKRCKAGGHQCVVEGRKPRTAPNKREYLLAQIRQKDAIIESLLKQLHNPYLATPLSIASYRMATSPSDKNNQDVIAWLDRLQESVRTAGGKGGPAAFSLSSREKERGDEQGSESEEEHEQSQKTEQDEDDDDTTGPPTLPDAAVPLGLIANLSLSNTTKKTKGKNKAQMTAKEREESLDDDNVGVANETYFMPGPASDLNIRANLIEQHSPPEILVHGLVTPQDVEKLFDIYFTKINPFLSLLNPILHTPSTTFARCPFLFTVICAISSRFYPEKSEIYAIAMHFAKSEAANALINGWKSVELCQAYLLMSYYAVPAKRWEEDRSWLYTGLAIRLATDLNLHQVSTVKSNTEKAAREVLNRTRTWMICFNLDRSVATQFGKPSTIKEDYITRHCKDWYKSSPYNDKYDIHICAYSTLLRIVAEFHEAIYSDPDSPTGLNKNMDFREVTLEHDRKLEDFQDEWTRKFDEDSDPNDPGCCIRVALAPFLVNYSRLVMYSFGFQQAFERGIELADRLFFTKCFESAKNVVRIMIEDLAPSGYMKYSPDGYFVFAAFASAFLLKLLRPEFAKLLTPESETQIYDLIARLIQIQSSPEIAIDDRHTPKLYARFLAGLLQKHRHDGATSGRLQIFQPPSGNVSTSAGFAIPPGSTASSQVFSVAPPQAGYQDVGHTRSVAGRDGRPLTPVYEPETTYAQATGPIDLGGFLDSSDFAMSDLNGGFEQEMLATMRAIKNPAWWDNMMMPGFSWTSNAPMAQANGINGVNGMMGHPAQNGDAMPYMNGMNRMNLAPVPIG